MLYHAVAILCCSWTSLKSCLHQMDGKQYCFTTKRQRRQYQVCTDIVRCERDLLVSPAAEAQAAVAASTTSKHRMQRVIATDGSAEPLTGVCVFFLRTNNSKPVTTANMVEVREYILSTACTVSIFGAFLRA